MEDRRSHESGFFDVERHHRILRVSPVSITASLSVVVLVSVIAWGAVRKPHTSYITRAEVPGANTETAPGVAASFSGSETTAQAASASDETNLSSFAPQVINVLASKYDALQKKGSYTPASAAAAAAELAASVKAPISYKVFSVVDIVTSNDTSYARMQKYQNDLRKALSPLSKNTTPEITIVSAYLQTKDVKYLAQARDIVQAYNDSVAAASTIVVPIDAVTEHVAILNAMGKFAASLSALKDNTEDPITVMALLQTYNDAEQSMIMAFDGLASYVSHHTPS